jgi:hypothetical protein
MMQTWYFKVPLDLLVILNLDTISSESDFLPEISMSHLSNLKADKFRSLQEMAVKWVKCNS